MYFLMNNYVVFSSKTIYNNAEKLHLIVYYMQYIYNNNNNNNNIYIYICVCMCIGVCVCVCVYVCVCMYVYLYKYNTYLTNVSVNLGKSFYNQDTSIKIQIKQIKYHFSIHSACHLCII